MLYNFIIFCFLQATSLLEAVHKGLLPSPDVSPTSDTAAVTLPSDALYYLSRTVIGMCRLPALYAYCSGPPNAYKMGWDGPDIGFIPEDLLVEREVLAQFNKQVKQILHIKTINVNNNNRIRISSYCVKLMYL